MVDNHPVMLKFMTRLLEKKGHQVLTASDGLSALDILKTSIPDVMFIDLIMPNIDGEKLCQIIRGIPKLKDAYLVILSAIAVEGKVCFTEFGADACIAKGPFNKMAEHVLTVMDHSDLGRANGQQRKIIGREDIHERQITKELLSFKRHFEATLNNMSEGILELTPEAKIVYVNPEAISIIGIAEEKLLSSNFVKLFNKTHYKRIKDLFKDLDCTRRAIIQDSPVELNDKQVSLNVIPIKDDEHSNILVILSDVTRRKQAEEQIKSSLKEKEVLLQEIHHRVKNNMQIISSLLKLQASNVGDEQAADALMEFRGRVQAMAIVHETLYGSDTLVSIDLKDYISKLANEIFQTYKTSMGRVKLKVDAEDIKLGIEQATPLGLITNELVTNSLKYAFPENRSGEIVIRIRAVEQDSIEFVFSDNDIGIPEALDWRNTDSLGLRLVIILAEDQLDGTVSLDRRKGTHFTVRFRHEENKQRVLKWQKQTS